MQQLKTRSSALDEETDALLTRALERRKAKAPELGIPAAAVTHSVVIREIVRAACKAEERALAQEHPELPLEPMTTT
jgi:hypothetical protein